MSTMTEYREEYPYTMRPVEHIRRAEEIIAGLENSTGRATETFRLAEAAVAQVHVSIALAQMRGRMRA